MTTSLRTQTLDEAKRLISEDRNTTYGEPIDNFSRIAEALNAFGYRGPEGRKLTPHDVPFIQVVTKLSRLVQTPDKADNWVDIAGYAATGREVSEAQKPKYVPGEVVKKVAETDKEREERFLKEFAGKIMFKWLPATHSGGSPFLRMALPKVLSEALSRATVQKIASETAFASKRNLLWTSEKIMTSDDYRYFVWKSESITYKDANA